MDVLDHRVADLDNRLSQARSHKDNEAGVILNEKLMELKSRSPGLMKTRDRRAQEAESTAVSFAAALSEAQQKSQTDLRQKCIDIKQLVRMISA